MSINDILVLNLLLLLVSSQCLCNFSTQIPIEFDETEISKLNLNIKWKADAKQTNQIEPTKFVLIMEQKRFMSTEYSSPVLIDDESTIESSTMIRTRFKARWPLRRKSKIDCALNCINSSSLSIPQSNNEAFDCNIFYYEPKYKICVLYQYDFSATNSSDSGKNQLAPSFKGDNSIYEYFIDECEIDEILSGIHGYVRYCRRLLEYKESHTVKINPYVDYRFSLSVRGPNNTWSDYSKREYQYAPKITIEVKGELRLGNNISIECKTDLHPSIIDSIQWKNSNQQTQQASSSILYIKSLNHYNIYQTFFCEIRYNQARMMQKAFKLNITAIEQNLQATPPKLKVDIKLNTENLRLNMNWSVQVPLDNVFTPERIMLLYSENYKPWRFVGKYLLFQLSKHDNIQFINHNQTEEIMVKDEEECAMHCLQSNFCDHFVFRQMDSIKTSAQKNCHLATNTNENLIDCRLDSVCADLASYEKNIQNNSVSISLLPNVTYKFRIQLKDKFFNWTNLLETDPINIPLKLSVTKTGPILLTDKNIDSPFTLNCSTKVNRSVPMVLSWTKNGKDIIIDDNTYTQSSAVDSPFLNSVLKFNKLDKYSFSKYSSIYKCKATYSNTEMAQPQTVSYFSDEEKVKFTFSEPLSYNVSYSNITVPTIPGLLFELSCQVSGNPRPRIKWLIDGINYSEKKFESFTDEPFVINITFMDTWNMNHILVFKMDNKRELAKYECILNDNVTIREHYIKVVDEKPQLDVKLDTSKLNELRLGIQMNVEHKNKQFLNGLSAKPLKMSIMYVENSTFSKLENSTFNPGFYETIRIAPDTLSHDTKSIQEKSDRVPIATLKHAERSMLSCKLLCFDTPFCHSYEHLVLENSCDFFSSQPVEAYYNNLIDLVRNRSSTSFNLLHLLRGNILSVLQEELTWTNKMLLADTKSIATSECESRHSTAEIHCSDQLFDFDEKYTFYNLTPGITYQFKVQVSNPFGKSDSFITQEVEIPFPIDPITEKIDTSSKMTSLVCSTSLKSAQNLEFKWYRNEQLISADNNNFEQKVTNEPFSSELKFKVGSDQLNGYYTCSLDYSDYFSMRIVSRNSSIIFRTRSGPFFNVVKDVHLFKQAGSSWSDVCTAEGWPLPRIEWNLNGVAIPNTTDENLIKPHIIQHHRHLTVSSYVIVNNFSKKLGGRYECIVNGVSSIKNVTIEVDEADDSNPADKQVDPDRKEIHQPKSLIASIFIPMFLMICFIMLVTLAVYSYLRKRKRSNSDTSLSYNRIEEEVMTGVDNPNLLDDDPQMGDPESSLII